MDDNKKLHELKSASLGSAEQLIEAVDELQLPTPVIFIGPGCRHLLSFLHAGNCANFLQLESSIEIFPHARELLLDMDEQTLNLIKHRDRIPMPVYVRNNVATKSTKALV